MVSSAGLAAALEGGADAGNIGPARVLALGTAEADAAQDYLSPLPPGAAIDGGDNGSGPGTRTRTGTNIDNLAAERQSRDHFAVLAAQVQAVDWLDLHPEGHRRAMFSAAGAVWVTP